jgi:hypothetical protein
VSPAHAAEPFSNSEDFRINQAFSAALPTIGRKRFSLSAFNLALVGDTGLEPVTPSVSSWESITKWLVFLGFLL